MQAVTDRVPSLFDYSRGFLLVSAVFFAAHEMYRALDRWLIKTGRPPREIPWVQLKTLQLRWPFACIGLVFGIIALLQALLS